jgi:hypothetical protein
LATLSGKDEKKLAQSKIKSTEKKKTEPIERKPEDKTKSVGWKYRYRVSKMREAQKREKSKLSSSKKQDQVPVHELLDAELAQLSPEQRVVGWKYRLVQLIIHFRKVSFALVIVFDVNLIH